MSNPPSTEYDTPWKDAIEQYFPDFIAFFFPDANEQIDWSCGYEFLDRELQQIVRDAELGRRLVDRLVRIYLIDGEEVWVLVHIEVQSQEEDDFAERMFVYHYRIYDRYQRRIASLAVLGDDRPNWRPDEFGYELFGCQIRFQFPIVKLLDYQPQWSVLDDSFNPFATVVMAHLTAKETTRDRSARKAWKLALTRRLYEKGYQRQDVINLFRFIDWMMTLPAELEREFWQEIIQEEEARRMPYLTTIERIALEEGREEGLVEGRLETLLMAIKLFLRFKFGTAGSEYFAEEFSEIQNVELLQEILTELPELETLDELHQRLNSEEEES
ncbi:MAG TPA: cytosolic protein [Oscillatoriales cyanobacterium M59_W2019_021]|nr:cytosolic protein [Oscillatoriales cyanobacterium M59_W2019_021]